MEYPPLKQKIMNNIDLRNEYANAKNRAFDQGCEGGFRADYTEWLEQKLESNAEGKLQAVEDLSNVRNSPDILECPKCSKEMSFNNGDAVDPQNYDDPNYSCKCGNRIYLAIPSRR